MKSRTKNNIVDAITASCIAIPIGMLIAGLVLTLSGGFGTPENFADIAGGTIAIFIYGTLLAIPFVFLYGIPMYALLRSLGLVNYITSIFFGVLPGIIWVAWSNSDWVDPAWIAGGIIAVIYHYFRIKYEHE